MKRLALVCLLLACTIASATSRQKLQGYCQNGGTHDLIGGLLSANYFMQNFPSCTVTVYATGTTNLATIYSDNSGTPLANPFTSSSTGLWGFYADVGRYDVRESGGGIVSPFTLSDFLLQDFAGTIVGNTLILNTTTANAVALTITASNSQTNQIQVISDSVAADGVVKVVASGANVNAYYGSASGANSVTTFSQATGSAGVGGQFLSTSATGTALKVNGTNSATKLFSAVNSSSAEKFAIANNGQLTLAASVGVAPMVVTSTTPVSNLTLAADSQLPTISTAGKVSDSALSSKVAIKDQSQSFTGTNTFTQQISSTIATGTAPFSIVSFTPVSKLSLSGCVGCTVGGMDTVTATRLISTVPTGTSPITVISTTPVANLTTSPTTYDHNGNQRTNTHAIFDACTLGTDCAITLSGSAVFSSSSSYGCFAIDTTAAAAVRLQRTSGSQFTFTGTGTDVLLYMCMGI